MGMKMTPTGTMTMKMPPDGSMVIAPEDNQFPPWDFIPYSGKHSVNMTIQDTVGLICMDIN